MNELKYEDLREGMDVECDQFGIHYRGKLKKYMHGELAFDEIPGFIAGEGEIGSCIENLRLAPPVPKTFDNLVTGDSIRGFEGERKILAVCGDVVCISVAGYADCIYGWDTIAAIKKNGYSIVQPARPETAFIPTLYTTEAEIIEKFGCKPGTRLKIEETTK